MTLARLGSAWPGWFSLAWHALLFNLIACFAWCAVLVWAGLACPICLALIRSRLGLRGFLGPLIWLNLALGDSVGPLRWCVRVLACVVLLCWLGWPANENGKWQIRLQPFLVSGICPLRGKNYKSRQVQGTSTYNTHKLGTGGVHGRAGVGPRRVHGPSGRTTRDARARACGAARRDARCAGDALSAREARTYGLETEDRNTPFAQDECHDVTGPRRLH